jgi:hypothetical protein
MSEFNGDREFIAEMTVVAVILLCVLGYALNHGDLSKPGSSAGTTSSATIEKSTQQ